VACTLPAMIRIETPTEDALQPAEAVGYHRHENAYAAIILSGDYREAGIDGSYACRSGEVVIHPGYHAHADQVGADGADILNIPLDDVVADRLGYAIYRAGDVRALARLARRDPDRFAAALDRELEVSRRLAPPAWLERYVGLILRGDSASGAARASGRSIEHAGRTCQHWYGLTPLQLRREERIRRAISGLRDGGSPAEVAHDCGFADQPHLTRVLKVATGRTPARFFG